MTRETINCRLCFSVALYAEAHDKVLLLHDPVHERHVAVALAAVDPPMDVHRMIEINEVRKIIDFVPHDRLILKIVLAHLRNLGIGHRYPRMAEHTGFESRYPGARRGHGLGMAHEAADLLIVHMNPVAEKNRLFGAHSF